MPTPAMPPILTNRQGGQRRVGFELEYQDVSLPQTAELIAQFFHGTVHEHSQSHFAVESKDFGSFSVKLDFGWMQEFSERTALERRRSEGEPILAKVENVLGSLFSRWVPNEIVTPPLPLDALGLLEDFGACLRQAGASGTRKSPIYTFGLHINPELPDVAPEDLGDYIAAFALLQEDLQRESKMDLTRRLSSYAKLFDEDYLMLLMREDYRPAMPQLVEDYLTFNPTRNRALDMLPAFAMWESEKVMQAVAGDKRVRARPTFHYRLPNSDIDREDWSMIEEWNRWLRVEELAENKERLRAMKAEWRARHGSSALLKA